MPGSSRVVVAQDSVQVTRYRRGRIHAFADVEEGLFGVSFDRRKAAVSDQQGRNRGQVAPHQHGQRTMAKVQIASPVAKRGVAQRGAGAGMKVRGGSDG